MSVINGARLHSINPSSGVTSISPTLIQLVLLRYSLGRRQAPYIWRRVPVSHWDDARFSAFQEELQAHVSNIRHLHISADIFVFPRHSSAHITCSHPRISFTVYPKNDEHEHRTTQRRVSIPDTLFGGTTPRLSCLELQDCGISWESPLLRGLIYLDIRTPSTTRGRASQFGWMLWTKCHNLRRLPLTRPPRLFPAFPIPPDVKRTVTLPSLTHFDISDSARDCGLALAHLALPALTWSGHQGKILFMGWFNDVREVLPYVARHAHGSQDAQPLQSLFVNSEKSRIHIMAWTKPDIDIELRSPLALFVATRSARVTFIATNDFWSPLVDVGVFDAAMAALPLDSIVTLTAQDHTRLLDKEVWLRHAPRWPLLQRVRLTPPAAHGLRGILLEDHWERESMLLPSLTNLVLVQSTLSACRTLRLCDVLMKRVEQGVPLETLDLRSCLGTSRAVELLSEIVVDVLGPAETLETKAQFLLTMDDEARGLFIPDVDSDVEADDYDDDDDSDADEDAAEMAYWGMGHYEDEDEDDYDYSML